MKPWLHLQGKQRILAYSVQGETSLEHKSKSALICWPLQITVSPKVQRVPWENKLYYCTINTRLKKPTYNLFFLRSVKNWESVGKIKDTSTRVYLTPNRGYREPWRKSYEIAGVHKSYNDEETLATPSTPKDYIGTWRYTLVWFKPV